MDQLLLNYILHIGGLQGHIAEVLLQHEGEVLGHHPFLVGSTEIHLVMKVNLGVVQLVQRLGLW